MKVAHFGNFAPFGCGMFHSICDQIMAERLVGIDSQFIDYTADNPVRGQFFSRVGLSYEGIITVSPEWAKDADILVRHSAIPKDVMDIGLPIVMVVHGRPEYSFMLELTGQGPTFSRMTHYSEDSQYKAFMVLGEEYVDMWKQLMEIDTIVKNLPLMVDLKKYNPWGEKHSLGDASGSPNIMIADRWRRDTTPFYLIFAAAKFIKEECPTGKLHCFALPDPKNNYISSLIKPLMRQGVIGKALTTVENMDKLYRTMDFVLSPNNISNRIIRESLASGCPIMAAPGCKFTDYTAHSGDIDGCVKEMSRLWRDIVTGRVNKEQFRKIAEENFSFEKTGRAALVVYEEVLRREEVQEKTSGWTGEELQKRSYKSYQAYLTHQKSKLDGLIKAGSLENYDIVYRKGLGERLAKFKFIKGKSALCLAARVGTEVKAFLDNGAFAVGIDLNPGKDNKYVVVGDFHELQYAENSVDIVFTNSLDHVFEIDKVLSEVLHVLRSCGKFIIDVEKRSVVGTDKWSSFWWKDTDELIKIVEANGFRLAQRDNINCLWFTEQLLFEKEL